MSDLSILDNEEQRIDELKLYQIMDSTPEAPYDALTSLASIICETPISLISLVDETRQWFKSKVGISESQTPRDVAFCAHAISQRNLFIVSDATQDLRFKDNPLVKSDPHIRFYAGAPLITPRGYALGTICVVDKIPRVLSGKQITALKNLATQVVCQLELRLSNEKLKHTIESLRSTENEIHLISSRYTALIENLNAGIFAERDTRTIIFANQIFYKMFSPNTSLSRNYDKNDLSYTQKIKDLFINPDQFSSRIDEIITKKESITGEELYLTDGRILERDYVPVFVSESRHSHLWVYRDVTEKKQIQNTLEKQKAQMMESAKFAALGEMAAGISHEINNPLAIIQGRVGYLKNLAKKNSVDNAIIIEYSEKISSVIQRISKIIKGLRSFARDGENEPFEIIKIESIILDTLDFCQEKIKDSDITLEILGIPSPISIQCRSIQISQILLNLLNNARDAIEPLKEKWIRVQLCDENDFIKIRIEDSGTNLSFDVQKKIFQPFFTTKPAGKGTGLGLSISKGIAQAHHGSLELDYSSKNTCFVLSLPKIISNE